MTKMEQD
jgi:hypothetical protein